MDNTLFCISKNLKFFISIIDERTKLFEMIGCYRRDYSNIRRRDREKKVHLSSMIYSIFENEIFRIFSYTGYDCHEKYPEPEKGIFPSCLHSNNRERKSVLAIIMVWRDSDISRIRKLKIARYIGSYCCLSDCSSHSDNIRMMNLNDHSCEKSKKSEKKFLHKKKL